MSKTAFMFPGQGSQCVGMGADFYEACPKARAVYDMASELIGIDMKKLCFEENEHLDQTEFTQIALLTTGMAMEQSIPGVRPYAGCDSGPQPWRVQRDCVRRRYGNGGCDEGRPQKRHPDGGGRSGRRGRDGGGARHGRCKNRRDFERDFRAPTLPITTARVRLSSPDMRRQCRGFGKVKRSRRKAGTSAERKRPVPFPDDGSCVPGADRSARGRRFYGVEDSVCDECNRPVCA